jgi:hypothetical protein
VAGNVYLCRLEGLRYHRRPMATKPKVLYLRNVSADLVNKLKAAAALSGGQSIQKYVLQLLLEHVTELERKGQLPKGRGS